MVLGFATDVGSRTSHTAIMARSLNIPAVVGLKDISQRLAVGDHVLLDGASGVVILNPSDQTLWEYGEIEVKLERVEEVLTGLRDTFQHDRRWPACHPFSEYRTAGRCAAGA